MPTRRQERLNELLREELTLLIAGRLDDPRVAGASVTRVETTQDLSTAKVYVTFPGAEDEVASALAALAHASNYLRGEMGDLGLRRVPDLLFTRDRQFESGERVLAILDSLGPAPPLEQDPSGPVPNATTDQPEDAVDRGVAPRSDG